MNTPWNIMYPFKWQPVLETNKLGFFFRQEHVVPQAGRAMMFSLSKKELQKRQAIPMYKNSTVVAGSEEPADIRKLRRFSREVFSKSARLSERQRVIAE